MQLILPRTHVKLHTSGNYRLYQGIGAVALNLILWRLELRHFEDKYVTYFACSNSDESEDEERNQWNMMQGFV